MTVRRALALTFAALSLGMPARAQAPDDIAGPPLGTTGEIRFIDFQSKLVPSRSVQIWLPPGYEASHARYPVLYMHDGQNVFDPASSAWHVDWGVDETMTRLIAEHRVRPAIVVAIYTQEGLARFSEYMPARAAASLTRISSGIPGFADIPTPLGSDAYLRFIVTELKPYIDRTYRTRTDRANTFIMGSSMGGLISLYAVSEYPEVFGGAACISTHWTAGDGAMIDYMRTSLPSPATHRIWFDHGTLTLDSAYARFQVRADSLMRDKGYVFGDNWVTRVYPGAEHSERSWRVRIGDPLVFLLGTHSRR